MIILEKSFAVAVDFQSKILPHMFESEKLIDSSAKLLKGLGILNVPIYMTQQYTKGLGMTVDEITQAVGSKNYTEKLRFGAYEDIKSIIPGPDEKPFAIVCGIEAHVCVLQTVFELKEAGYMPYLIADCVSSRREHDRDIAIERFLAFGITVTTYEALLFELLVKAGDERFKAISHLVK